MSASPPSSEPLLNVPNLLSLARIPLAVVLFACIVCGAWLLGLIVFLAATVTDWLDGWWARRYGPLTLVGRNLDPLVLGDELGNELLGVGERADLLPGNVQRDHVLVPPVGDYTVRVLTLAAWPL